MNRSDINVTQYDWNSRHGDAFLETQDSFNEGDFAMANGPLTRRGILKLSGGVFVLTAAGAGSILTGSDTAIAGEIYTGLLGGTGAGGYDVVSYHTAGRAVKGKRGYTAEWKGATWRFSSKENRDAFQANPARYAPQYGGHCAYAAAQDYKAKGDPNQWNIVNGKLYLNFNASIKRRWEQDIPGYIAAGDRNWPGLAGS